MTSNPNKEEIAKGMDNIENRPDPDKEAKEAAARILQTGDPIEYILDVFNEIHIGDRRGGEVLILSAGSGSISNCQGLHPKLSGESGKGKSHSCKTMIHLMPAEYTVNTSLSAKAVFYHSETFKPGVVLFSDDIELTPELESIIKRSTSEFHQGIEHQTVNLSRKAQTLKMPPRVLWWLASVDSELDTQTLNRQIGVDVDDSAETDKLVMEQQLRASGTGQPEYPETFEVGVCREIFRYVKEHFIRVVIPFHDRIEWRGAENRRNLPVFLDMVKVYALFYYRQREVVEIEDGTYEIRAAVDDFISAERLIATRAKAQATKLNEREIRIIDFLASYGTADIKTIKNYAKLPYETTRRVLCGRSDKGTTGLLGKVKELSVEQITREIDGGRATGKEFTLSSTYNRIAAYESPVSLRDV